MTIPDRSYTPQYQHGGVGDGQVGDGRSTASLVLGIVSLVLCWIFGIGIIPGIIAIALAAGARRTYGRRDGLATAGFVCGIIGTVISALFIIILLSNTSASE